MESLLIAFLSFVIGAGSVYGLSRVWQQKKNKKRSEHQSVLLLEKIRSVCKLVTVEGDFAEIYQYENSNTHFLKLFASKKKALMVVNARVLIGFDLNEIKIKSFPKQKKMELLSFSEPKVLSIEPDLQYYDIKNSMFNRFDSSDLTALNQEAKTVILEKIPDSRLMQTAKKEALEAILLLEKIASTIGWTLDYSVIKALDSQTQPIQK